MDQRKLSSGCRKLCWLDNQSNKRSSWNIETRILDGRHRLAEKIRLVYVCRVILDMALWRNMLKENGILFSIIDKRRLCEKNEERLKLNVVNAVRVY